MAITTIKFRRGPSSEWAAKNPVLENGEPGFEYEDEGSENLTNQKIGDGVTAWLDLPYVSGADVTPPPSMLAELTDTDVTGADDGYALIYDADSGKWMAQPVGGVVGAWENDQVVNFTAGTPVFAETSFTVDGAVYPANPQATITVTEAMLASASRADVGFVNTLEACFLLDSSTMTGGTSGTITGAMYLAGETVGMNLSTNTTTQAKGAITFVLRDAKVGDVVTFKFRLNNAAQAGVRGVSYSAACYPQSLFKGPPEAGGFYLYQSFLTGSNLALPQFPPTTPAVPSLMSFKLYDGQDLAVAASGGGPETHRSRWAGQAPHGIYNSYGGHEPLTRLTAASRNAPVGGSWEVNHLRAPSTIQFDRVAIPPAPS